MLKNGLIQANIFLQLTLAENQEEDRTVTIMGILSTLGSVLEIVEENSEVMAHVEVQVLRVIKSVLDNYQIGSFISSGSSTYLYKSLLKGRCLWNCSFLLVEVEGLSKDNGDDVFLSFFFHNCWRRFLLA